METLNIIAEQIKSGFKAAYAITIIYNNKELRKKLKLKLKKNG